MIESKIENYSLYQTFSQNIPSENLSAANKKYIIKSKEKFTRPQEIAFVRLILEHHRLENTSNVPRAEVISLPYGSFEEDSKITFDLNLKVIPRELLWILYRFTKVCDEESS